MKKSLFSLFLAFSSFQLFAEDACCCQAESVCEKPIKQEQSIVQGYSYLLEGNNQEATIVFSNFVQNAFQTGDFLTSDDFGAAAVGLFISIANQNLEPILYESIGRFFVNVLTCDEIFDEQDFDEDFDDEDISVATHLETHYNIKKETILNLLENTQDSKIKNFILKLFLD